ncbi:MAG: glucans biosynthesis glucosyltransferase MdoH [Pseudomonadota bacterium]
MPPSAPLAHPRQTLSRSFHDGAAPAPVRDLRAWGWRAGTFLPALAATGILLWSFLAWFATDGTTWAEALLTGLIGVGFFWIALTFVTVVAGSAVMLWRASPNRDTGPIAPLDVALLMPIHEEAPWDVFGNAAAMLERLAQAPGRHTWSLHILSDTRDPDIAAQEEAAFDALRSRLPDVSIWYRRRVRNTDRKVGNIADWLERWGGGHDAMLVLDADSLMSAAAIRALADAMGGDPGAGLIQSFPRLIGARTLFARSQQFANAIYGTALAEGLARWAGREGNYWGHNAILRIRAFAASAGLPHIGRHADQLILSHDFVEAGLLRRAGWAVRFLPGTEGSYEETPPTLIDHVLRDRRWCRGNLQHLGLLGTRGFHALSRFHLFHGAVGYLLSPLWFLLLTLWVVIGVSEDRSVINYFSPANPTMPNWPEMSPVNHVWLMVAMYALLILPKLIGALALIVSGLPLARVGGGLRFGASLLTEIALSVAYAPILMVQQTLAIASALTGRRQDWIPQARIGHRRSWSQLLRFHAVETALGLLLLAGMWVGYVSPWLLPIMGSLLFAVPLSRLSERTCGDLMTTPQDVRTPLVVARARHWRDELKARLAPHPAE